jgi:glycerol-3-phosphate dehydrogenase
MTAELQPTSNSKELVYDLVVVGGGINGTGIAADAAGRGLKVGLFEAKDFAGATSSASSKLVHGGLRYLEHYEFRLVSEALAEREVLLKKAPHIIHPMRFRLPHRPFLRPAWMIRIGMFLYDHLGKRTSLKASQKVVLNHGIVTKPELKIGFEYSDCWVDDARLTLLNARHAQEKSADVRNYCRVTKAVRQGKQWQLTLCDDKTGVEFTCRSRALVNATGPWVKEFLTDNANCKSPYGIRMIKGSHIIVPKIHDEPQAYILQNEDKRIVFVIPYLNKYSMIGTTDVEYQGDPRAVKISPEERDYLLKVVNQHFIKPLSHTDIVSEFSGVRPLCDDESNSPQAITRDYTLSLDAAHGNAPLLSVFGGKLTTYRKLAEAAMKQLQPFFPNMGGHWTAREPLPGGEEFDKTHLMSSVKKRLPFINEQLLERWVRSYGTRVIQLLESIPLDDAVTHDESVLGIKFSDQLYQCEIDYLIKYEFAYQVDDILWRRSKLGLEGSEEMTREVREYLEKASDNLGTKQTVHKVLVQELA